MQVEEALIQAREAIDDETVVVSDPSDGSIVVAGLFFPATLVADAEAGMALVDREQFGPALPIIRFARLEDALEQANALGLGVEFGRHGLDDMVSLHVVHD